MTWEQDFTGMVVEVEDYEEAQKKEFVEKYLAENAAADLASATEAYNAKSRALLLRISDEFADESNQGHEPPFAGYGEDTGDEVSSDF